MKNTLLACKYDVDRLLWEWVGNKVTILFLFSCENKCLDECKILSFCLMDIE